MSSNSKRRVYKLKPSYTFVNFIILAHDVALHSTIFVYHEFSRFARWIISSNSSWVIGFSPCGGVVGKV